MRKKKKIINIYLVGFNLYIYNTYNDTIRKFDILNDDKTSYNVYIKHYAHQNYNISLSCKDYYYLKCAKWL